MLATSCLGSYDCQQQHQRDQDHTKVETPRNVQTTDDFSTNQESNRKRPDPAPLPETEPETHSAAMTSDIICHDQLAVRVVTLQRRPEEIE